MTRHIWLSFAVFVGCHTAANAPEPTTTTSTTSTSTTSATTTTVPVPAPIAADPNPAVVEAPRPRPVRAVRAGAGASHLERIAQCESGGNPRAISRSGKYTGKHQFSDSTWASVGGSGRAMDAPEAEQDARALELYRRRGSQPWPACGRRG